MSLKISTNETPVSSSKTNKLSIIKVTTAERDALVDADLIVGMYIHNTSTGKLQKLKQLTPSRIWIDMIDADDKNVANGIAGLNASVKLLLAQMQEVMALNDLTDASISAPVNNQVLTYDAGTALWKNQAAPGGAKVMRGLFPQGDGSDGTVTISANTDLGSANFKQYTNLTVNAGVNLFGNSPLLIIVKETLTLNGTIHVDGKGELGGPGGGTGNNAAGGNGGGTLIVICNAISGTGILSANGTNGVDGSQDGTQTDNGVAGNNGITPDGAVANSAGGGGVGGSSGAGGVGGSAMSLSERLLALRMPFLEFRGSGGGEGGVHGGTSNRAGGGAGAGGLAILAVNGATTGVTVRTNGGNGGAAPPSNSGGGGGGGGFGGAGGAGGGAVIKPRSNPVEAVAE